MRLQIESIIMIASNGLRASDNVAVDIANRQDVGRFSPFAPLIGHRFAPFFSDGMCAIQIEFRKIQIVLNGQNTRFPHFFKAAIAAPLAKMVVNCMIADFFFSGCSGLASIGNRHGHDDDAIDTRCANDTGCS